MTLATHQVIAHVLSGVCLEDDTHLPSRDLGPASDDEWSASDYSTTFAKSVISQMTSELSNATTSSVWDTTASEVISAYAEETGKIYLPEYVWLYRCGASFLTSAVLCCLVQPLC